MKDLSFTLPSQAAGWALIAAISLGVVAGLGGSARATPTDPAAPAALTEAPLARLGRLVAEAGARGRPAPTDDAFHFTELPAGDVKGALTRASQMTGVSRPYLVSTARRESGFDPDAAASTSSAQGLFQFVDATWLEMVDRYGAKYGLAREAKLVRKDAAGRPKVADPAEHRRILDLRNDARLSALLACELARENQEKLSDRLDRAPTDGELYLAHFLGAKDAAKLITAAERQPRKSAAELFPDAARSNRSVFYRGERARTVAEVVRRLT